jgi:hypothetical protein
LAHLVYVDSSEYHNSRESARAFADGVREKRPKVTATVGEAREHLNKTLNHALKLDAADMAAGMPFASGK